MFKFLSNITKTAVPTRLWKQLMTSGDEHHDDDNRPGIFDQKGRYKWDAWNGKKGMSQEDAKKQYIQLVHDLKAKHGTR
eukprot:1161413-Pelagomonas_calceolata.AAC.3